MKIRVKFEIVKENTGEVYRVDRRGAVEDHAGTLSVNLAGSKGISINGSLSEAALHALEKGPVGFWSSADRERRARDFCDYLVNKDGELSKPDPALDIASPTEIYRTVLEAVGELVDEAIKSHEEKRHADDWKNVILEEGGFDRVTRPPSNWRETEELEAEPEKPSKIPVENGRRVILLETREHLPAPRKCRATISGHEHWHAEADTEKRALKNLFHELILHDKLDALGLEVVRESA